MTPSASRKHRASRHPTSLTSITTSCWLAEAGVCRPTLHSGFCCVAGMQRCQLYDQSEIKVHYSRTANLHDWALLRSDSIHHAYEHLPANLSLQLGLVLDKFRRVQKDRAVSKVIGCITAVALLPNLPLAGASGPDRLTRPFQAGFSSSLALQPRGARRVQRCRAAAAYALVAQLRLSCAAGEALASAAVLTGSLPAWPAMRKRRSPPSIGSCKPSRVRPFPPLCDALTDTVEGQLPGVRSFVRVCLRCDVRNPGDSGVRLAAFTRCSSVS